MFDTLGDKLQSILGGLRSRGKLDEETISKAIREIRLALLEADVNLAVVKEFTATVKERALGQDVMKSLTPTTMASSTTMPMASTSPKSDSMLSEKPRAAMTAIVPISDTGIASRGIRLARQFCRKRSTTTITSPTASKRVWMTALIDSRTKTVGL